MQLEGDGPLPEAGYEITRQLLRVRPGFTAIFAFNDLSAFGAIGALRDAGLRVPDDVSVVGFDDILGASSAQPAVDDGAAAAAAGWERSPPTIVKRITAGRSVRSPRIGARGAGADRAGFDDEGGRDCKRAADAAASVEEARTIGSPASGLPA